MENLRWLPGTKIVLISSSPEDCYIFVIETQWFILMLLVCYRGNTKWLYSLLHRNTIFGIQLNVSKQFQSEFKLPFHKCFKKRQLPCVFALSVIKESSAGKRIVMSRVKSDTSHAAVQI